MRKVVLAFLLLTLNSIFALGQTFTFSLSGIKNDYIRLDSIARATKKLAGSDSSSIQTTTDTSGYYFDNKKIKRNRGYIAKTQVSNSSHVQENKFTVSGTVTDCKYKNGIKGVRVKLAGKDGTLFETKTDSIGNYVIPSGVLKTTSYVLKCQEPDRMTNGSYYGTCSYPIDNPPGYMSSNAVTFDISDTINKILIHNFCLIPIQFELRFPSVCFKKNSTDFLVPNCDNYVTADTSIDCITGLLLAYKSWVIELSGHSDKKEKDGQLLSEQRAKKVFDLLVSKGINSKRIVIKGYGTKYPVYHDKSYISTYPEVINSRIEFSILRKDFGTE